MSSKQFEIYLEVGEKKTFAGSVDWPGLSRSERDEEYALRALYKSIPRYARILEATGLGFEAPGDMSSFEIVERLAGNRTTDFGAPDMPLTRDDEPVAADEIERLQTLLKACWAAFDRAVSKAEGKQLQKGPRGGGRDLEKIVEHILMADESYLKSIGWKLEKLEETDVKDRFARIRREMLDGFAAAARGELPKIGPRGGRRWSPRYYVRRAAWHVIDHAWEIEDRIL